MDADSITEYVLTNIVEEVEAFETKYKAFFGGLAVDDVAKGKTHLPVDADLWRQWATPAAVQQLEGNKKDFQTLGKGTNFQQEQFYHQALSVCVVVPCLRELLAEAAEIIPRANIDIAIALEVRLAIDSLS